MVGQQPRLGMYQDTLTIHRYGHFSADNSFHIVKLLIVDFQLKHRHRLRYAIGHEEGCNVPRAPT